jgi:hypothetical protein
MLQHGYENIHSCPFHLAYFVLQPVTTTRAWNYSETSVIAGFNPERLHTLMLAVPNHTHTELAEIATSENRLLECDCQRIIPALGV